MLGLDLELLLTGLANPVMFTFDKGVIVDALAVVFCAEIALHRK
jgi:hypothetical protein